MSISTCNNVLFALIYIYKTTVSVTVMRQFKALFKLIFDYPINLRFVPSLYRFITDLAIVVNQEEL